MFAVDVEQYGAVACTGLSQAQACKLSTRGFDAAIAAVSTAGGGIVHAKGPGYYKTAAVEMKSNVRLVVHAGASVNASHNLSDWSEREIVVPECAASHPNSPSPTQVLGGLFFASLATNFSIAGPGAVNGAAAAWNHADDPTNFGGLSRCNMFIFSQCSDVVVEDLLIQDSSEWTLNPMYSKRVSFRRLRIDAPALGSHGRNVTQRDSNSQSPDTTRP